MITQDYLTISPTYWRDYKSAGAATKDFLDGKDFVMESVSVGGTYCSVRDFAAGVTVSIRYAEKNRVVNVKVPLLNSMYTKARFVQQNWKIRGTDLVTGCGEKGGYSDEKLLAASLDKENQDVSVGVIYSHGFVPAEELNASNVGKRLSETGWSTTPKWPMWRVVRRY